jgi:large subunit ribosomal protein L28
MSRECEICGKKPLKAAKLTFSHKQNVHRQAPNLQSVKVNIKGTTKTIKVCTSCIKAGKIDNKVVQ